MDHLHWRCLLAKP
jgi:hypothetical protein